MVGTRAVKTGWATGDKIYVWLEGNQVAKRPDFTLTYGSGGWTASELREGASLADGNKLAAVYSSYNDLSVLAASSFNLVVPHETIGSVTAYAAPLYILTDGLTYSFDGTTITANLNKWLFDPALQVVISGLDNSLDYALNMSAPAYITVASGGSINVSLGCYLNYGSKDCAKGLENNDGKAFYFKKLSPTSSTGATFTLYTSNGDVYKYTKTVKLTDRYSYQAAKIPFSSFVKQ